jgi:hypothetical protein
MRTTTLVLSSVLLAACSGASETDQSVSELGTRKGIDYAWARPSVSGMKAEGFTFAARYLSHDTTGKNLSAGEAHALKAAGIDVVVVWEGGATAALGGYSQGVSDAQAAEGQAKADGMPSGRPIYFAVDFDATSGQEGAIGSYFDGVASVLGRGRTGAYAGFYVIQHLFNAGKIKYAWQTYAWSYGNWDSRAQLRQVLNDISAGGSSNCCDKDQAVAADFGQWGYGGGGGGFDLTTTGPSIARNADGRLEAFARGSDESLWHIAQTSPGGAWGAWTGLGGKLTDDPAVGMNKDGQLEVFYRGTDGQLWHLWQQTAGDTNYSTHHALGGGSLADGGVTVASNADGRLEVFARGTNNRLYHIAQTAPESSWTGWEDLNGQLTSNIAVGTNTDGRLEAFYRGTDNAIWHLWQTTAGGKWSSHYSLGGYVDPSLTVGRNADGRLELFVRGTDAKLYHMWQDKPGGAWSKWASLDGALTSDVSVSSDKDGRLDVTARGTDNGVYHIYQTSPGGAWSAWAGLGGSSSSDINLAQNADGRLEAFFRGTNAELYHVWQTAPNAGWSSHYSLGGKIQP